MFALSQSVAGPSQAARPRLTRRSRRTAASVSASSSALPQPTSLSDYARLHRDDDERVAKLQTAIVSFERPSTSGSGERLIVDLVSVIHVADREYYADLQRRLEGYDRVLYELVADKSRSPAAPGERWKPPRRRFRGGAARGLVGWTQKGIASTLALTFQLDEMDYWRDNWWHADLDLEAFERLSKRKGESIFQLAGRLFGRSFRLLVKMAGQGGKAGDGDGAGSSPDRLATMGRLAQALLPMPLVAQLVLYGMTSAATDAPLSRSPVAQAFIKLDIAGGLKLLLAGALCNDVVTETFLEEEAKGSVIIGDRNAAAAAAIVEAIDAGSSRVAVFFGSAHLPDLERRLVEELGFARVPEERGGHSWVDAWRIPVEGSGHSGRIYAGSAGVGAAGGSAAQQQQLEGSSPPPPSPSPLSVLARNPAQAGALFGLSAVLATDLYLWELLYRWVGEHVAALL